MQIRRWPSASVETSCCTRVGIEEAWQRRTMDIIWWLVFESATSVTSCACSSLSTLRITGESWAENPRYPASGETMTPEREKIRPCVMPFSCCKFLDESIDCFAARTHSSTVNSTTLSQHGRNLAEQREKPRCTGKSGTGWFQRKRKKRVSGECSPEGCKLGCYIEGSRTSIIRRSSLPVPFVILSYFEAWPG